jgi:4-alpha-glucanotransferase
MLPAEARRAGVLLHVSSLPGPWGVGDLGPSAYAWIRWLEAAGQRVWQTLPLSPIDEHGCPYASPSAMASEPLLLSIDQLIVDGWLLRSEAVPHASPEGVDWRQLRDVKWPALWAAAGRVAQTVDLQAWLRQRAWATEWGLFAALSDRHGIRWTSWPEALTSREDPALNSARDELSEDIARHVALQWLFEGQWTTLRRFAGARGVEIWGDLPFYVGAESCDTWQQRRLFRLASDGRPELISGVPPDAFSPTGQLWGHAVYDVEAHRETDHAWWRARAAQALELFDRVRIDHFRAVEAGWMVPAEAEDARSGRWEPGLGAPLLEALCEEASSSAWFAEDLGVITPAVEALRVDFELPGMSVLQFAFGGNTNHSYLPHNITADRVVYTATHDNDTSAGWYESASPKVQDFARRYLLTDGRMISWDLLRAAYRSPAFAALVPMQDILGLGTEARMNIPGQTLGNWRWRLRSDQMRPDVAAALAAQARVTGRLG